MEKLLFIYNNPLDGSYGGSQGTIKALDGLKKNFEVSTYSCVKKNNKIRTYLNNLIFGLTGNLGLKDIFIIFRICSKYDYIYFDVSIHGKLVKIIKKYYKNQKIVVNYHNCEKKFAMDSYKCNPHKLLWKPIYKAVIKNEELSLKYADLNILLTEEDKKELGLSKNFIFVPVTLKDSCKNLCLEPVESRENYVLFLGASMYANLEAVKYIIEKIAPFSKIPIYIVGKGMKGQFPNEYANVKIFDYVEALSELMINASAFLAPVFFGSGAKVKIAEALMYGKMIIGSDLAFCGYDIQGADCIICSQPEEYIKSINELDYSIKYYRKNRDLFLQKYSDDCNQRYYSQIKNFFENKNGEKYDS